MKKAIGILVKTARKAKGITQVQLGESIDIRQITVRSIEKGVANTGIETLEALESELKIKIFDKGLK